MKPVIVTKELISVGLPVMRGRDWCYSNQDGKPGERGEVHALIEDMPDWCRVKWGNGAIYMYRIGYNNSFDLYAYLPGYYDQKPQGRQRLTRENFKVGLKVELNDQATDFAKEKLTGKGELVISGGGYDDVKFLGLAGGYKFQSFDICTDQTVKSTAHASDALYGAPGVQTTAGTAEKPIYKFRKGDIVYLRPEKRDSWINHTGVKNDVPYLVDEVNGTTFKLQTLLHWQLQDQFMSDDDWGKQLFTQRKLETVPLMDMSSIQKSVVTIAENSKPNIKQNGNNNNKHPEPFKVRRPVSTIKGPKGRSGAIYSSGRSSSRSRICNY